MTIITPGIDFLVPYLVKLSIPPVLFTLTARYLGANYDLLIPRWTVIFASILSIPLVSASKIIWKSFIDRRAAAAHGARLIPVFEGKLIANLDILTFMLRHLEIGYPGAYILLAFQWN
jgi:hypothetical protein